MHHSVPFSRNHLADFLTLVTENARFRWPEVTYLMNSDVAWRLPFSSPEKTLRLWYDDSGLAAYAWFSPVTQSVFDLRCSDFSESTLFFDIMNWLEYKQNQFPASYPWLLGLRSMEEWEDALTNDLMKQPYDRRLLQVSALDADEKRKEALSKLGFKPTDHFQYALTRSLSEPVEAAPVPPGFSVRSVAEAESEERVATHRDAWFKSGFSLEQYRQVRAIDLFEPELDLVADNGSGEFGAYCIGWLDRDLGIGSFEPVGTRPHYRRLGLGRAVNLEGLRRMRNMGMHSAKIGTAGFNDRAFGLYKSCGFQLRDKDRTWVKEL
ncbi:MAG: GNAT family N-acetyltransferase [Pseudomonadales bacterium]|nr:GNAT family N-acetyltransferase [Pseudomonadales bacterium]